jgi:hypothetical protein
VNKGLFGVLFFLIAIHALAQKSNERVKWVAALDQPFTLDSLTVVPGSILVTDTTFRGEIHYEVETGLVRIKTTTTLDSLPVRYKVFPYAMHHKMYHKNLEVYDSSAFFKTSDRSASAYLKESREELFTTSNLYKSGVISRGITFGNRQDIFVNSVLNLQLDGKLSEKLNIRASITDQNIPYQPEGNTKLVQDFDNVFFEIYNDAFSLAGGDLILQSTQSYFLKYYRNVQGANIKGKYSLGDQIKAESNMAVSVSKGKFSSYQLKVMDGIMGPYKIYGPDHEHYIIIQANSERVYLDGRLLERGFNNHYVIDYNTAEITFTSNVMITKFSRVQIDFEYTNQAYTRTVIAASHTQSIKNFEVAVNFYQEKDNPNQPATFELSDFDKQLLSIANPEQGNAMIPGWDSVGFSDNRVLYKKIDTIDANGQRVAIFKYSDHPDSAYYQVLFTEVGMGKGDYVKNPAGINGRVYAWVSPVEGISQGNYLPMKVISLPNKKQMIAIHSALNLGENNKIFSELAISNQNENLFNKGHSGLKGVAVKTGFQTKDNPVSFLPGYTFAAQVDHEFTNKDFMAVDRYRPVEFDRDWSYNYNNATKAANDNILNAQVGIKKDNRNFLDMGLSYRNKPGFVNGWQATSNGMYDINRLHLQTNFFLLNNDNSQYHSNWLRYRVAAYYKSRFLFPGYEYRVERNVTTPSNSDSVIYSADNFEQHRFFIRSNDTLKTVFNVSYIIRKDRLPVFGELLDRNISRTANILVGTQKGKLGKLDLNVTFRELGFVDQNNNTPDQRSLLGRVDWSASFLKKHIRSELVYAIGNGRELKREYVFIPVPTGEGTHTWRDDNNDGKQDLDEFYIAINNDERNYIKLFTPTDEYVLAYDNQLNYRVTLDMPRAWKGTSGVKNFLGRFSNNLSISLKQKTADDRFFDNLVFNREGIVNEKLLSYRENIRNNLYFNRADPKYGFELVYYRLRNKQLLSEGFESRSSSNLKGISRIGISRDYNFKIEAGRSNLENSSDFLSNRNFFIVSHTLGGSFEWQPSNSFRFSTNYSFSKNMNEQSPEVNNERSVINEGIINLKFAKAANKNIDLSFRYTYIDFVGIENSAIGYELLRALQPGQNMTWTLRWQQKIFHGLQMNIFYEGRKSGDLDIIHIGRMQVMAMF